MTDHLLYVPVTPGDTPLIDLARETRNEAIAALLEDAAHMPYNGWREFEKRGYKIWRMERE